ncbi:MAG: M1 family metallopeptidase [Micromonosporaceae bacterium]
MNLRRAPVVAAVVLALLAGCTGPPPAPHPSPSPSATFRPGAADIGDPYYPGLGNGGYDVASYTLELTYEPGSRLLTGHAVIAATATQDLSRFNLDFHGLTLTETEVDGVAATVQRQGDEMVVTPPAGLASGARFTVDIRYHGVPTPYQGRLSGGFMAQPDGAIAVGEPVGAASWFPVNDHPRDKATFRIAVTAPENLVALSNGVLVSRETRSGHTTWTWAGRDPMASYLATVVIGAYRLQQGTHNGLPVVSAIGADLPTGIDAQLARTPEIIDFLQTQFGPYPFDAMGGIAINDHGVGYALENQTRPVYGPAFFDGGADATGVIAHELAHQWYGDSVSVDSWKEIWLNEGFASYAEWLWDEHRHFGPPQERFDDLYARTDSAVWSVPTGDPGPANQFSRHGVYERGAMTLQALRMTVGDPAFFQILRDWAAQRRNATATTAQFIALAEQVSGRSLDALFQAWLYGTTRPPRPAS